MKLYFVSDASKGLKNLTLSVYPEVIRRGQSAQLHCSYEVYDVPLYSVKWYRGIFEFYRYTPFEHPPGKTFFFNTGIKVDVSCPPFISYTLCFSFSASLNTITTVNNSSLFFLMKLSRRWENLQCKGNQQKLN
jgi:hypothetical protein